MIFRRLFNFICRNRRLFTQFMKNPRVKYNTTFLRVKKVLMKPYFWGFVMIPTGYFSGLYLQTRYKKWFWFNGYREECVQKYRFYAKLAINGIIAVNGIVFLMWQYPRFHHICERFFLQKHNSSRILPLIGSAFSHYYPMHIIFNMVAFNSFAPGILLGLGTVQFLQFYFTAAIFSNLMSKTGNLLLRKSSGASLGASGVLYAMIYMYYCFSPESRLKLIFVPKFTFGIGSGIKAMVLIDCLGIAFGWRKLDHFAHLGGLAYGYLYSKFLLNYHREKEKQKIVEYFEREDVIQKYQEKRIEYEKKKRRG